MEILLHVGAHRTATTTLQRMLGQSHVALQDAGLAYWGPKRCRAGLFDGLYGSGPALPPRRTGRATRRVALQARMARDNGAAMLLVSEENMLGTMRANTGAQVLYPDAGARVAGFAAGFAGHGLTIGISLRCYDAYWASVLGWRMRRGGPLPRPGFCDRLVTQPRRWRSVISDMARSVPAARVVVWTHETMAGQPDALVARLTGCRIALAGAQDRHNASPSLAELRGYLEDIGADPALARGAGGRFMPFDADQRRALRDQYAEDLAWLAAGAGGLAEYLDEAGARTLRPTGQGRGRPDDGEAGRLAHSG
jgi:hypothetical protein